MSDHRNGGWLAERAESVARENGFDPDFSGAVLDEIRELTARKPQFDAEGVSDLRSMLWSSIDNATSRDLDQVEWAEQLENGDIRLLIGIADVDAYVKKGSAIDKRARRNTVTVYTENRIFPMLPEELSTDLTSLNEGEDRLAVVADLIIKADGDVPVSTFFRAIVRNQAKLNYNEIGSWFDGRSGVPESVSSVDGLEAQIELQFEAAKRLAAYRQVKGALEFESIESAAVVEDGEVKDLVSVRTNPARKLIENFMVAANVEMAEFIEARGQASIRRVVRVPKRWEGIVRIAAEYGEKLPVEPDQPALAQFLAERRAADPEHFPDLSLSIVKLVGSGEYLVERIGEDAGGHFGLAVSDYAHSTAPNRRFTDLVIQRLVKAVILSEPAPYSDDELHEIAQHCNEQEKAARKVERKMRKVVAAMVMKRRIGENFQAIVTGVTPSGTFARILRPPVDGRIERGEAGLSVGEKVSVTLISADERNGFIDFAVRK